MHNLKTFFHSQFAVLTLIVFNFSLVAFRMIVTSSNVYAFLIWNLVLSGVPLVISLYLSQQGLSTRKCVVLSLVWLLFLPNAPYILTDFLHFRNLNPTMPAWFDLLLLASYAVSGLLFGLLSMHRMQLVWNRRSPNIGKLIVPVSAMLSGFGIYLGRFERFNSWDIISHPIRLFTHSISLLTELKTIGFTIGYGLLLLLVYYVVASAGISETKNQN